MRKMYLFVLMLITGCSLNSNDEITSNVSLKASERANFGQGITITVNNISDSRCPEGCYCFWAGEARVFFTILSSSSRLDTNLVLPSQVNFEEYSITLVSVNPYPKCDFTTSVNPSAKFLIEQQK